jgi:flagellar basal-body rod modification protein FlgD
MTTIDALSAFNGGASKPVTANEAGAADRFLKLLVTQMQNQDPLNPMDNAQITSQMAQINTVSGIENLNTSVQGLSTQFRQMQALQGASLVGRDITLKGNQLSVLGGVGVGGFDLSGAADSVKVEILNPAGRVVDTLDLGAQSGGLQGFSYAAPTLADNTPYTFRVLATSGTVAVNHTALMREHVLAVSTVGDKLTLETTRNGAVPYGDVVAVN